MHALGLSRSMVWILAISLLGGCAKPPKPTVAKLPIRIPSEYSEGYPNQEAGINEAEWNWIKDFDSEELESTISRALLYSYDLQAAATRMEMASANNLITGANRLPAVNGFVRSSRNKRSGRDEFSALRSSTIDNFNMGFNWNWEIDLWGRLKNQKQAAIADEQAAEADFYSARLSIAGAVTRTWLGVIEAQNQEDLAKETYQNFLSNQQAVLNGYKEGIFSAVDLSLIRADVQSSLSQWESRKLNTHESKRSLQILLGDYPDSEISSRRTLPNLKRPVPAGLPSELLNRRPDLVAAERRLASAIENEKIARKGFLPQISLTGNYGVNSQELSNLLDPGSVAWSLAGNLTQPIFRGGQVWGTWKLRRAQSRLALSDYANIVLQAFLEVESALQSEQTLIQQVKALGLSADENERAADLAWKDYEKGLSDSIITMLEARRRAFNTRSQFLQTRRLYLQNRVDLYTALGGPFLTEESDTNNPDPGVSQDIPEQQNDLNAAKETE